VIASLQIDRILFQLNTFQMVIASDGHQLNSFQIMITSDGHNSFIHFQLNTFKMVIASDEQNYFISFSVKHIPDVDV